MWTKAIIICYPIHLKNNREHGWTLYCRDRDYDFIGDCTETPDGWILYEMWHVSYDHFQRKFRSWDGEKKLLLIGESVLETYTLTDEEYHEFPSMPRNWTIPF